MARYVYGWDSVNKKKEYRGKYSDANPRGQVYFGKDDAGQRPEFVPKDWGTSVGFVGSTTREYTFSDRVHGTHTITAESYEEALRIAESMGFTQSDYKRKRGKR